MDSTVRRTTQQASAETSGIATIRWRNWPLADNSRWSWLLPAVVLGLGGMVWLLGGSWLLAVAAVAALAIAMWQFLLPVTFEICSLGIRRYALGRMRLVPWHAIRAYQLRSTGAVFFQRFNPTTMDVLNSLFVPYPSDEDEMVVALRFYLPHAVELPH